MQLVYTGHATPNIRWVIGSAAVEEGCSCAGAGREIIMGGGSFHPTPLDTAGVKLGPGWSGTCACDGGRPGPS